jgi:hypothetical protein
MTDVSIGYRNELHLVSQRGPFGRNPAGLDFAIVGVRA